MVASISLLRSSFISLCWSFRSGVSFSYLLSKWSALGRSCVQRERSLRDVPSYHLAIGSLHHIMASAQLAPPSGHPGTPLVASISLLRSSFISLCWSFRSGVSFSYLLSKWSALGRSCVQRERSLRDRIYLEVSISCRYQCRISLYIYIFIIYIYICSIILKCHWSSFEM